MKKIVILMFLVFITLIGYTEDLYFRVIRDTPYWFNINFPSRKNVEGILDKGKIIKHEGYMAPIIQDFGNPDEDIEYRFMQTVFYKGFQLRGYSKMYIKVSSEDLVPMKAIDLFDELFIKGMDEYWIHEIYLEALVAKDREIIREFQPNAWDTYVQRRRYESN